jgi:Ca2+/Na+ antiporter
MKISPYILIIIASLSNIGLQYFMLSASKKNVSIIKSFQSNDFKIALLFGLITIVSTLVLYKSNINLGQAIILIGGTSILLGSLIGLFILSNKLDVYEYILLITICLLIGFRYYKSLNNM